MRKFKDKKNIIERLQAGETISIELGCGKSKINSEAIGIDLLDYECVDLVGDIFHVLEAFPDGSVESIYSTHFLEHVNASDFELIFSEMSRILRPEGKIKIIVPRFSNPYYYLDPTHRTPFGLYTLSYICHEEIFKRKVPQYTSKLPLLLSSVKMVFAPFYSYQFFRLIFKKIFGKIINSSMFAREFYEENLCWMIPCYELHFSLIKSPGVFASNDD